MKLSIIIVNYNVKYFLASCLDSVYRALEGIEAEVFVVDNNSSDDSAAFITSQFPKVKWVQNDFNAGFSKANNQAIEQAKGEYILLLNPDTVVEENCFHDCIEFMDEHQDTGGLGVKMIDGSGKFLPESKRGLPTPAVAFYKIFGFSSIFPKSKRYGAYHLGFLDTDEINEIDILSGAFMFLRKSVIDQIGGLDESFFMYGEDIDLSYRITQAGFKNIYFPKTQIIHFKGESTKKSSVNYVLVFYRAMIIFAKKHFSNPNASLFSLLINLAVYFRAALALFRRLIQRIFMPAIDFVAVWGIMGIGKQIYETKWLGTEGYYPNEVELVGFPMIALFFVLGQAIFGGYRQPAKMKNIFKGLIAAALGILFSYALLDEELRFSRALVLMGIVLSFILLPLIRLLLSGIGLISLSRISEIHTAIVGFPEEIDAVKNLLNNSPERSKNLFYINPIKQSESENKSLAWKYDASLYQLKDLIQVKNIHEIIFCMNHLSAHELLDIMQQKFMRKLGIYLNPGNDSYIIKCSSINTIGDFILPENEPALDPKEIAEKRYLEIILSLLMILASPLIFLLYKAPGQYIKNMFDVLRGKHSLIGYPGAHWKKSFIIPISLENGGSVDPNTREYLVHYGIDKDLEIFFSQINRLDQQARS